MERETVVRRWRERRGGWGKRDDPAVECRATTGCWWLGTVGGEDGMRTEAMGWNFGVGERVGKGEWGGFGGGSEKSGR